MVKVRISPVAKSTPFDNLTNGFTSTEVQSAIEEVKNLVTESRKVKQAFEDFMFDAYAGNGGNDNQYAFTAVTNGGSSNVDGAVPAAGNDYEGIHILSSLTSATARPMVEAFNLINRIKLGALVENFEFRVRIEDLATIAQKFTCRYALMDTNTAGIAPNFVGFSYDPIYPVTPVAQVVTVTPIVTSKDPTQTFTETLNGTPYSHIYTTTKTITITPTSFPVATFQQINYNPTRANNTLYTITINGTLCSYTSDATATDTEIRDGLITAINSSVQAANITATANGNDLLITSDVLGQAFTSSHSATVVSNTVTANVPIEQYTVTLNGTSYIYTSDGTPTATEVCNGLRALINADGPLPITGTGTTTLILSGDVSGADFTYTTSGNMSTVDNTASTTATAVCNGLRVLINADGPLPVTATGTTTLILTADVPGTLFTYSGTANLTQTLTTANVAEVFYSGNWICTVSNNSTVTSVDSGTAVVANQWDKLSCTVNGAGTAAFFYVNDTLVATISTAIPTSAMRFIFKLEKTVGTTARTTSIDYIYWNKER